MTKGRVVPVPFPFDDLSGTKVRPAVCLTEPVGPYRHVVCAFISSREPPDLGDTDVILDSGAPGFAATGLLVTSALRLHRLMTITTSLILRDLGELPPDIQTEVSDKLRKLFELA